MKSGTISLNDPKLRLVNQYADAETGLYYNIARYYDPTQGRFISPDPAGIGDSIDSQVPDNLKLDMTVYASGQPLLMFDPDGAAKITYYLIDSTPNNRSASTTRWGFWLRDIGGANGQTQVLYDSGGSFLTSNENPLNNSGVGTVTSDFALWQLGDLASFGISSPVPAYVNFYAQNAISPSTFTVGIDDEGAREIVANLTQHGDIYNKYYCISNTPQQIFPSVLLENRIGSQRLFPGGRDGENDAGAGSRVPQGNDTFNCQIRLTQARAFEALNEAIAQQETGGADCTLHGCPAQTQNPLGNNAACWQSNASTCPNEPASYGRSQFTVNTFLEELIALSRTPPNQSATTSITEAAFRQTRFLTRAERMQLGFLDANGADTGLRGQLVQAERRAAGVRSWRNIIRGEVSTNTATLTPTAATLLRFAQETGLGLTELTAGNNAAALDYYSRAVKWEQLRKIIEDNSYRRSQTEAQAWARINMRSAQQTANNISPTDAQKIDALLADLGMTRAGLRPFITVNVMRWEEGWQAFRAAAIFSVPQGGPNLRGIFVANADSYFRDNTKFEIISNRVIQREIAKLKNTQPTFTEEDIVAVVARFHNSGNLESPTTARLDTSYTTRVIRIWNNLTCVQFDGARFSLDPIRTSTP